MREIIFIAFIICSFKLNAQVQLKGNKLSEKLVKIENLLIDNKLEEAINQFESKDSLITKEKVRKKDINLFNSIAEKINEIKSNFNENNELIENWNTLFQNREYEKLSDNFSKLDSAYIYQSQINDYNQIKSFISNWDKKYNSLKEKYIFSPQKEILNIHPQNYNEATRLLEKTKNKLNEYSNLLNIADEYPNFTNNADEIQRKLDTKRIELEKFVELNKPLSQSQISSLIKSKDISIPQITKYLNQIDYQFSKFYVYIKINGKTKKLESNQFENLLNLDVVGYFNLSDEYNTELKRKYFKETDEYKQLYQQLKDEYNQIINSYFYMPIYIVCSENKYNLQKQSFRFRNSEPDEFHFGYNSGYLQFNNICVKKPSNVALIENRISTGYETFMEQLYYIPVRNEKSALQIEDNCSSVSLMYILKIEGIEKRRTSIFITNYIKTVVKNILIFNRDTEEIYFNQAY